MGFELYTVDFVQTMFDVCFLHPLSASVAITGQNSHNFFARPT
jgi:hypothetical protein